MSELAGATSRQAALEALRTLISSRRTSLFGLDFPFSLPAGLMGRHSAVPAVQAPGQTQWEAFVTCELTAYASPSELYAAMHAVTGGREPKRCTDREAGTPFSAINLRLVSQTYYGIREVLGPLVRDGAACVPPFQSQAGGRATVIEICPASTLRKGLGMQPAGYKGPSAQHSERRREILGRLTETHVVTLADPTIADRVISDRGGDGLDSIVAAVAAAAAARLGDLAQGPRTDVEKTEGRVYYRLI